ncbi:MAG: outer membrane lipoprotein carrier protein LolA [Bacteroidales bacterium]|nr:outer membrane lipoprotein carrier protein LolA [Bacteroidales bacterium]
MKRFLTIATALFCSLSAMAQLQNANDASLNEIAKANEKVTTIQCDFSRTQKMEGMTKASTSDGKFCYTKPKQLSMVYNDGETFVINNDQVAVGKTGKTRNLKATNKHVEDLATTLLACMSGKVNTLEGTLKKTDNSGKQIVYTIAVDYKMGRSKVKELELKYDKSDLTLASLKLTEDDGSFTTYELKTKTINKDIPAETYAIKKNKKNQE